MAWPKGKPRPPGSGRQPGSLNKKSKIVQEILEDNGINLVAKILYELPALDATERTKALIGLMPYVYPKLTSTELSGKVEGFRIILEDYTKKDG